MLSIIRYIFFSHLKRKTLRILSLKRIPKRCVLVLKSARLRSSATGVAGDLPNIDNRPAAISPRKEFILTRKDIRLVVSDIEFNIQQSIIFAQPFLNWPIILRRSCLSSRIRRTIDAGPESPADYHSTAAPLRYHLRQRRWFCNYHPKATS